MLLFVRTRKAMRPAAQQAAGGSTLAAPEANIIPAPTTKSAAERPSRLARCSHRKGRKQGFGSPGPRARRLFFSPLHPLSRVRRRRPLHREEESEGETLLRAKAGKLRLARVHVAGRKGLSAFKSSHSLHQPSMVSLVRSILPVFLSLLDRSLDPFAPHNPDPNPKAERK